MKKINDNLKRKAVVSFSGGKDSMLCIDRIKEKYEIIGLISTFDDKDNTCFHCIPKKILKDICESLNLPLICAVCGTNDIYEVKFEEALKAAKKNGAEVCVFGDIDITNHRQWGIDRCNNCSLEAVFPLWQGQREEIVNEFIDKNYTAIIKKVNLKYLSEDFLGKVLDKSIIKEIKETGSDACGENGEYHTVVVDGPLFKKRIDISIKSNKISEEYGYLEIK